ncbi:DUF401 family protein [bacterium]|nr:DUF401 family protein [bacterium]
MPNVLVVLACFCIILVLNRVKMPLNLSILVGAIILGFSLGYGPVGITRTVLTSCLTWETWRLVLIVVLILALSRLMKETGQMKRIVETFHAVTTSQRITAMILPALIGILPMPGGALFSAPMVEEGLKESHLSPEHQTAINYWFRHIWEYWWPLYPGVILVVSLLRVETWRFSVFMFPLTILSLFAGSLFLFRKLKDDASDNDPKSRAAFSSFISEIMPIIIIVLAILLFSLLNKGMQTILELPDLSDATLLFGIMLGVIWIIVKQKIPRLEVKKAFLSSETWPMVLLLFAIMIFKGILIDTDAVSLIRDEFAYYHIPVLGIVILMPFISGLITGIAIGFVGVSFPLIVPLFESASPMIYLAYAGLAYVSGYMGMMLSPVHLCLLVTRDYFKANLIGIYPYLLKPAGFVFGVAFIAFLIMTSVL